MLDILVVQSNSMDLADLLSDATNLQAKIQESSEAAVDMLLTSRDENGSSPLIAAARVGSLDNLIIILDTGADPNECMENIEDHSDRKTPLQHGKFFLDRSSVSAANG